MKRRITSATLVAAMLLLGSFAIPAAAQDVEGPQVGDVADGVLVEDCAVAVAAAYGLAGDPVFEDSFAAFFQGGNPNSTVLPQNEQDLIDAVEAFLLTQGQTLAGDTSVCGIYLEVAPIVIERPEPPTRPTPPAQPSTEVLGTTLARTGANTALLGLAGLALLGLGVVAVRRTRSDLGVR